MAETSRGVLPRLGVWIAAGRAGAAGGGLMAEASHGVLPRLGVRMEPPDVPAPQEAV